MCVPARNAARFLGETLQSVLRQTWQDYELVVCDNASTDATPEICARFTQARVAYHRFETPVGQSGNWNRCLGLARGVFLVLLHADDLLEPAFLDRAVAVLDRYPDVVLAHGAVQHIDAEGRPLVVQRLYADDRVDSGPEFFARLAKEGCLLNPAGVLLRADAIRRAGPFTDRIRWGIDWHMWMRMALEGDVAHLAAVLARYRHHGESGTSGVLSSGGLATDEWWAVTDALRAAPLDAQRRERLAIDARRGVAHRVWCHAEQACLAGHHAAAWRGLIDAARLDPHLLEKRRFWGLALGVAFGRSLYSRLVSARP